jgi:Zn-dependent peptidase ImmA (M78 family)
VSETREKRAFRFAGALLLPADAARERISETLTLHGYLRVKADYGLSVSALVYRAEDLGLITAPARAACTSSGHRRGGETTSPCPSPMSVRYYLGRRWSAAEAEVTPLRLPTNSAFPLS